MINILINKYDKQAQSMIIYMWETGTSKLSLRRFTRCVSCSLFTSNRDNQCILSMTYTKAIATSGELFEVYISLYPYI
jgi:hypothetical protein